MSLVELMIALVILTVLASVAIPAYRAQVVNSRRAEGRYLLMEAAGRQETFFAREGTYAGTPAQLDYAGGALSENGHYRLGIGGLAPTGCDSTPPVGATGPCEGYRLDASPAGAQATDADCGTLQLTSTGAKRAARDDGCW